MSDIIAYPQQLPVEPDLCEIGGFTVTHHTLRTVNGTYPLAGTQWQLSDRRYILKRANTAAVVFAILLIPFSGFLSLLLLLIRDSVEAGFVEISVQGPGFYESTQIHAGGRTVINASDLSARLAYIRNLVASQTP